MDQFQPRVKTVKNALDECSSPAAFLPCPCKCACYIPDHVEYHSHEFQDVRAEQFPGPIGPYLHKACSNGFGKADHIGKCILGSIDYILTFCIPRILHWLKQLSQDTSDLFSHGVNHVHLICINIRRRDLWCTASPTSSIRIIFISLENI